MAQNKKHEELAISDFLVPPPEGIVVPPPSARALIEKLAEYLARHEEVIERTKKHAEAGHKNFLCMLEGDPFHDYYEWRLSECKQRRTLLISAQKLMDSAPAKKEPEKPKGPAEPPPYEFSARMPPNITAEDNEVIQLTAQFTAARGPQWMRDLAQKENANPAFDFLRTQHSYHQYFSRLVDQYKAIIEGKKNKEWMETLDENLRDRFAPLKRAKQRAEWIKFQETEKTKQDEEETKRREEFARIDWHDYQIMDTIEFTEADEDGTSNLDPPIYLSDLQRMSMEQKAAASLVPEARRLEETMPWHDPTFGGAQPAMPVQPAPYYPASYPPAYPAAYPSPYPPYQPGYPAPAPPQPAVDQDAQATMRANAMADAAISQSGGSSARTFLATCPICNNKFPPDQLQAHIKIELMDPDARKQQERADARYQNQSYNYSQELTGSIKRFVGARPDLFDSATSMWAGAQGEPDPKRRRY